MSRIKSILAEIRSRQDQQVSSDEVESTEPIIATRRMNANDWQEFKRKFVEEYGGEPVQPSGMTHGEFLNYIKTSGYRENDEFNGIRKLKDILRDLNNEV